MTPPLLRIEKLCCSFGRRRVLDDLDLELHPGEAVLLAGRNGAGKSTLLRCLAGVLLPDGGRIVLAPDVSRRQLGFISDRLSLLEEFTLARAVAFHTAVYATPAFDDRLLRQLDLALDTPIKQLSAGQRAIFHLSLVLAQSPRLLLVDEILHLMDPFTRELFIEALIGVLAGGQTTLLLVGQTFGEIERIPERLLILDGGKFALDTGCEEFRKRTRKVVVADPPIADWPLLFRHDTGLYKEYFIHPWDPQLPALPGAEFQDVSLAEAIKAYIGGHYGKN